MKYSLTFPLLPLFLAEFAFGMLYALLIHWISVNHYLRGSTAWSVVIGDGMTLFLQWLFIHSSWDPFVTLGCFACSGLPMVITYLVRHQQHVIKVKHIRRPWPTVALKAREDALLEISHVISEIERTAKANTITTGFLLEVTNTLHCVKKTLTSV